MILGGGQTGEASLDAILVSDLTKVYPGGFVGVSGVSFRVEEGEIYCLIGPNGSGKTTTLRIVSTVLKPTSGRVEICGVDALKNPLEARRLISYLPEEAGGYEDLTGREFIEFFVRLRLKGSDAVEAIEEAYKISGLGDALKRKVKTYSKGMRRLLALSAVLSVEPRVAILDEPTAGLDVERSLFIRDTIKGYNKSRGVSMLLSSHNMLEVEYLCDRVGIIYKGRIVAEGGVKELKEEYGARNLEEVFVRAAGGSIGFEQGASG